MIAAAIAHRRTKSICTVVVGVQVGDLERSLDSVISEGGADDLFKNVIRDIKIRPDKPELHAINSSSHRFGRTRI